MIVLEMYLNGKLIDSAAPSSTMLQTKYTEQLKSLTSGLEKKHKDLLLQAGNKPDFILSGVQSRMNHFVPLCHPQHAEKYFAAVEPSQLPGNLEKPAQGENEMIKVSNHSAYRQLVK